MERIGEAFLEHLPAGAGDVTLRVLRQRGERLRVRQGVVEPVTRSDDFGATVVVATEGGEGWAGTSDLSPSGLLEALRRAQSWARWSAARAVAPPLPPPTSRGTWRHPTQTPWQSVALGDKLALLRDADQALNVSPRIVDREAALWHTRAEALLVSTAGAHVVQETELLVPDLAATAADGDDAQLRTLGGRGVCRQGGWEVLADIGYAAQAPVVASEALQLLAAPPCPTGVMDVLLAPDQMVLQVHESIGHPIELDRILGDERNYAGTSFVTPEMFGSYQYGSELLNVTFDPSVSGEFASYGWDDDGLGAERVHLIERGTLLRPLGGARSQARAGLPGVASSRATSWNRPTIDRMANLNLEPGDKSEAELIAGVERGVLMRANTSWSIDDSRNKFQFGCEWGQRIENGELREVVKKPNYRGISATFWRNLVAVGDATTWQLHGSPYCGKGEPNQAVRVGHATPMCHFAEVSVFGGVS